MSITINPKIDYKKQASFYGEETNKGIPKRTALSKVAQSSEPKQKTSGLKGFATDAAYAWVNLAEGFKGVIKGAFYGFLAGTTVAAINTLRVGHKKYKNNEIKFSEQFSPKKAMSRGGKIFSYVVAGTVFVANLIWAKMRANQRTAGVDHMLYEGHRNK